MVPLVTVVAFTLMGIEGIADEIEMPFGKTSADLPLGNVATLVLYYDLTTTLLQNGIVPRYGAKLSSYKFTYANDH